MAVSGTLDSSCAKQYIGKGADRGRHFVTLGGMHPTMPNPPTRSGLFQHVRMTRRATINGCKGLTLRRGTLFSEHAGSFLRQVESNWTRSLSFSVADGGHPLGDDHEPRSPHLGQCRGLLAQHRSNRLVADAECSGQITEGAVAGFAPDGRLLLGRELAPARAVV